MIVIVDYGMGNLASVQNMLRKVGESAEISSSPERIRAADKLLLPGVGAFDQGMANLERRGLVSVLTERVVEQRVPLLGICLGMQLLTNRSDEGKSPGLGWIAGETVRLPTSSAFPDLRVPHMGWNSVVVRRHHELVSSLPPQPRFYFVHSYYVVCRDADDTLATTQHGIEFTSAVQHENIFGVQFHPEKSHKFGMALLKNFVSLPC